MKQVKGLSRRTVDSEQSTLFDLEPTWQEHWWGMPEFTMGDARPRYRVTVNFYTLDDLRSFGELIDIKVTPSTDSITFPPESIDKPSDWEYCDEA